jgi:O-antigen ligase
VIAAAGRFVSDLRLPAIATLFLAPLAVSLVVGVSQGRVAYAAAAVAAVPVLWYADRQHGETLRGTLAPLLWHPLAPFAALYGAAAAFGLLWGVARGNDLLACFGQTFTAALFLLGFCWAAPRINALATGRFWLWLMAGLAVLSIPPIVHFATVMADYPGVFVRLLGKTAFYGFVCVILALGVLRRERPWLIAAAIAFFGLLTVGSYTRSYWLGGLVGLILLGGFAVRSHAREIRRHPQLLAAGVAALAVAVAGVAVSPLGRLAAERVAMTKVSATDVSLEVRSYESRAVLRQIRETPFTGVGSGGEFTSLHQTSGSNIAYGETNFTHNAYLYFPLKFGVLGLAALIALAAGVARCLRGCLRRERALPLASQTYVAALMGIMVAAVTAPNLVDPLYSTFCGAIAGLAGMALAEPSPVAKTEEPRVAAAWA